MQCPNCGSEKFEVVRTIRNKKYDAKGDRIIHSIGNDMRMVLCSDCMKVYMTESQLLYAIEYDEKKLKQRKISIENVKERAGQNELF